MNRFLAAAAVVVLGLTAMEAATAAPSPRQETVRFEDLDANSRGDTVILYQRLRSAARGVCGHAMSTRAESDRILYDNCVERSIVAAADEIDRDLLIEYVDERVN